MKKQFELIVQFKFVWGLIFTATILLYSVVSMFLGNSSMEFILIWQFVLITMLLTFIHYLTFGEFLFTRLSSKLRLAIHFLLCYITLFISAYLLEWINISKVNSLAIFTLGYVFLYLAISFSLYVYYRITGEQLNNKLAIYKQKKNIN
jgi:hypothetical protein